jgi:seryl-tRNA synthetase
MLDINILRKQPEVIKADLEKRNQSERFAEVEKVLELDAKQLDMKHKVENLRAKRNVLSREIGAIKKSGGDAAALLNEAAKIPLQIETIEADQKHVQDEITHYLMRLPNILHKSVPEGEDEEGNTVHGEFGKKPSYAFDPKSHVDIIEEYGWADLKRGAKIAGSRQYFLKGDLVLLDMALQRYALDFMQKRGFEIVYPPFMMHREAYEGVTDLKDFEDVMYKIQGEDLYLIATSEHPLTAMYQDEIFQPDVLPIKTVGISTCFRKEAGAHGKDQKGIFRVHQFNKVEQVIFCEPEQSWDILEELLENAKAFFESLGFHFRIVNICTGDIGTVAAKKYDIEVWYPVQQAYREVVSCSNCTDYQSRRLQVRVRGKDGNYPPHTLNATCVATSRALVAIIENFQQKDGSIRIPDVLVDYMGGKRFLTKPDA